MTSPRYLIIVLPLICIDYFSQAKRSSESLSAVLEVDRKRLAEAVAALDSERKRVIDALCTHQQEIDALKKSHAAEMRSAGELQRCHSSDRLAPVPMAAMGATVIQSIHHYINLPDDMSTRVTQYVCRAFFVLAELTYWT